MPKLARKQTYKPLVQLPPLTADDQEGLRLSIATSGVAVPIVVWKNKYIIDGWHRKTIADELGYECPEITRADLDEEEARVRKGVRNRC